MKRFAPLVFFVVLCGLLALAVTHKPAREMVSPMVGKAFPPLVIAGQDVTLPPEVTMVNVFASWCLPCVAEHPALMALSEEQLLPVIGIAWKNKAVEVDRWLAERGNPYTQLVRDERGEATIKLALTGVPETFIVDKKGVVAYHTSQPITPEVLAGEIIPLVERLKR